jgi:hypothetical protein
MPLGKTPFAVKINNNIKIHALPCTKNLGTEGEMKIKSFL